jgi:hypothetical protein
MQTFEIIAMASRTVLSRLAAARKVLICAIVIFGSALTFESSSVSAGVLISVNKNTQQMSVSVDGVPRYEFNSPMPHSIFFHRGYAIHGSYEINRLGGPASHGCIRLHPENAATLFALVQREGMPATKIVVYGNNPTVVQRRAPLAQPSYEDQPATTIQPGPRFFSPFRMPFDTFDPGRVY